MNERHFRGNVAQVKCLFGRSVAAADNSHFLVAIKEPVTGGTGRNAAAFEFLFRWQTEIQGRGAGRYDQRVTGIGCVIAFQDERSYAQIGRVNMVVYDFRVLALHVFEHAIHEFRALQSFDIARPVVDIGCRHQLATLFYAGDDDRV